MRSVKVEDLTIEKFMPFGQISLQLNPTAEKIGSAPIEFFRDMAQLNLGTATLASFSTVRVEKRDYLIDVLEYHSSCSEAILPLDNDILVHVGPATPPGEAIPLDKIRVFRVPLGTLLILRPGVWHHAPFTVNDTPANVLIVLPERTYANDGIAIDLEPSERIKIDFSDR